MTSKKMLIGAAGEYYVLSQLLRQGFIAAKAPDGAPNMDILVTDVEGKKLCAIQVKTLRGTKTGSRGWPMQPKHETLIHADLFYVFVDIGWKLSDPTVCYILPSIVAADAIRLTHDVWRNTPRKDGKPYNQNNRMRVLRLDYSTTVKPITEEGRAIIERYSAGWLDKYRDDWSVLPYPEYDGF